ncbi:MAG: hypothetical protein BGO59_30930 [Spirosoma sp. 48-14]|nr:MAG: hypothetical protein BGO59_30930 [Spirosoma sp. 48-14]
MNFNVMAGNNDEADILYKANLLYIPANVAHKENALSGWLNSDNHSAILMQFTGLIDKNGKEIYEGDIKADLIDRPMGEGQDLHYFVCVYITEWSRFSWLMLDEYRQYTGLEPRQDDTLDWILQETYGVFADETDKTEVIGNIYENPELLNQ